MRRTASAEWNGNLRGGNGKISSQSGALTNISYSFSTRFENQPGTNPEELIASAHAGCFTMALSGELEKMGLKPERLHTDATVSLEKLGAGWTIRQIHLSTSGEVPAASPEQFAQAARQAKENCPISRVLRANITLDANLTAPGQEKRAA